MKTTSVWKPNMHILVFYKGSLISRVNYIKQPSHEAICKKWLVEAILFFSWHLIKIVMLCYVEDVWK